MVNIPYGEEALRSFRSIAGKTIGTSVYHQLCSAKQLKSSHIHCNAKYIIFEVAFGALEKKFFRDKRLIIKNRVTQILTFTLKIFLLNWLSFHPTPRLPVPSIVRSRKYRTCHKFGCPDKEPSSRCRWDGLT